MMIMKFYLGSIDIFSGFNNGFRLPPWHHPISQIDIFRLQAVSSKLQASKKLVFYRVFGMLVISRFSKCLYFLIAVHSPKITCHFPVKVWMHEWHGSTILTSTLTKMTQGSIRGTVPPLCIPTNTMGYACGWEASPSSDSYWSLNGPESN